HVAGAEDAVAEGVDHVEDGVEGGHHPPRLRQQVDRIEHAAEIDEGGQHKGRNDGDVVKAVGIKRVEKTRQGEHGEGNQRHEYRHGQVVNGAVGERKGHAGHDDAHRQTACHTAGHKATEDDIVGNG